MSKKYIWVVERKAPDDCWHPIAHEVAYERSTARMWARVRRQAGWVVRVRQYAPYIKGQK